MPRILATVLFNLVFSENVTARQLWQKLGFQELGIIPGAVLKNDARFRMRLLCGGRWRKVFSFLAEDV